MECRKCRSGRTVKDGRRANGSQKWLCRDCGHIFAVRPSANASATICVKCQEAMCDALRKANKCAALGRCLADAVSQSAADAVSHPVGDVQKGA